MSPGSILMREGCGPLALSRGWTDGMFFFLEMIFVRELGFLSYPRGRPTKAPPAAAVFRAGGFIWENFLFEGISGQARSSAPKASLTERRIFSIAEAIS